MHPQMGLGSARGHLLPMQWFVPYPVRTTPKVWRHRLEKGEGPGKRLQQAKQSQALVLGDTGVKVTRTSFRSLSKDCLGACNL